MSRISRWKLPSAVGLALASLSMAVTALLSLSGIRTPMESADAHDRRAFALLNTSSSPHVLDDAEREVRRALDLSPYNNAARLRLTYIDSLRRSSIGPVGMKQLGISYYLVPMDHTVAAWRVKFALEHWRALTPDLRAAVGKEAMAFMKTGSRDADVRAALAGIQNPEGRVAVALWQLQLAN